MKMNDLYNEIGQILFDLCPEGYLGAWANVEMIDDVWSGGVFYKKRKNEYVYVNDDLNILFLKFQELRQEYKKMPGGPWSSITFFLSQEGRMKIDLGYEDVSDFGKAPARRNVWIKKYLGEDPSIDWEG